MATNKQLLVKFYLAEKFDKDRNMSFNLKKQGLKTHQNFKTFEKALTSFIEKSLATKAPTRVWFHRDGAFRGTATVEQCEIILKRIKQDQVQDQDVIEYINKEDLVDKAPAKKQPSKDKFFKLLENASIYADIEDKPTPKELSADRIHATVDLDVEVEQINVTGDANAYVTYHFTNGKEVSDSRVARFNYAKLAQNSTILSPSEPAICSFGFGSIVSNALIFAQVDKDSSALTLSAPQIQTDAEVELLIEQINVLSKDKAIVTYKFTRDGHVSQLFVKEFNFTDRDLTLDRLYAREVKTDYLTQEQFYLLVADAKVYAEVEQDSTALGLGSHVLKTTTDLDLVVEQVNVSSKDVAFVTYHYAKDSFVSQSQTVAFDFRGRDLTNSVLWAQDSILSEEEFVQLVQTSSIYLDITDQPALIEVGSLHVKTDSALSVNVEEINVTSDLHVYVTYYLSASGLRSNSATVLFDFSTVTADTTRLNPFVEAQDTNTVEVEQEVASQPEVVEEVKEAKAEVVEQTQPVIKPVEVKKYAKPAKKGIGFIEWLLIFVLSAIIIIDIIVIILYFLR
ncbi:hypothetical protein [Mycoplasma simbae]|uniref:hypothetical protein n=1 Tax=Mycoplasma simbae TaxID=36744 RepID=UPI00068F968E|nr:hypothetical protein [Mycoplasma simbae]